MFRYWMLIVALIAVGLSSGCGGYGGSSSGSGGGSGISATITNAVTTVQAGAMYTFDATSPSNNGYTAGISWSISPASGAGTLSTPTNSGFTSTVIYTAPMSVPSPNSVTITATPADSAVSAATDTFMISAAAGNKFSGRFAFAMSGVDATSEGVNIAGSMTADGLGNITGGEIDFDRGESPATTSTPLAGAYTLDANMRGVISITSAVPGASQALSFAFTLDADGNSGVLSESDANGFDISGTLHRQDSTAFSLAKIASEFAFTLESNSASPVATAGTLTIAETSSIAGIADSSKAGAGPLFTSASVAGHVTAPPDANGRGTLMLATSGGAASRLAYYVVSEKSMLLIETDSASAGSARQIGVAERQMLPFSAATANGASFLRGAGFDAQASASRAIDVTGTLAIENLTHATIDWSASGAGGAFNDINVRSELVTFDPASGRGTIQIANGSANHFADSVAFYLAEPGKGFFVDTTEGRFNRAMSGDFRSATVTAETDNVSELASTSSR